ncbi:hypothetical protein GCK72_024922 [Caenorhabditis remanei]|uniref:Uncharacterized protein n=1 Tax=Caenorhabditis remanei TaxID=31234 RepID=A0A6A5G1C1_CAERE|nr:hypothetical protein GCK72_024922 [Caenorhabditis remanei]KAF1748455.1 hypothetical protein GCK72_024922 [Caenorhabditis remanei]
MQYITVILTVFFFAGVSMAIQDWKIAKFGDMSNGDNSLNFDRYITHKRAINGHLRRSSIHWGKRTPTGMRSFERDIPLVPEEYLVMWPAPEDSSQKMMENEDVYKTTTSAPETANHNQRPQDEVENHADSLFKDNRKMERVAKAGIRPKLQLSSRLWGR